MDLSMSNLSARTSNTSIKRSLNETSSSSVSSISDSTIFRLELTRRDQIIEHINKVSSLFGISNASETNEISSSVKDDLNKENDDLIAILSNLKSIGSNNEQPHKKMRLEESNDDCSVGQTLQITHETRLNLISFLLINKTYLDHTDESARNDLVNKNNELIYTLTRLAPSDYSENDENKDSNVEIQGEVSMGSIFDKQDSFKLFDDENDSPPSLDHMFGAIGPIANTGEKVVPSSTTSTEQVASQQSDDSTQVQFGTNQPTTSSATADRSDDGQQNTKQQPNIFKDGVLHVDKSRSEVKFIIQLANLETLVFNSLAKTRDYINLSINFTKYPGLGFAVSYRVTPSLISIGPQKSKLYRYLGFNLHLKSTKPIKCLANVEFRLMSKKRGTPDIAQEWDHFFKKRNAYCGGICLVSDETLDSKRDCFITDGKIHVQVSIKIIQVLTDKAQ